MTKFFRSLLPRPETRSPARMPQIQSLTPHLRRDVGLLECGSISRALSGHAPRHHHW